MLLCYTVSHVLDSSRRLSITASSGFTVVQCDTNGSFDAVLSIRFVRFGFVPFDFEVISLKFDLNDFKIMEVKS